jgi:hypothetical protein
MAKYIIKERRNSGYNISKKGEYKKYQEPQ